MLYTHDERRLLEALSHKRGVVSKAQIAVVAETLGLKEQAFSAAWDGMIAKRRLRFICNETAEMIAF